MANSFTNLAYEDFSQDVVQAFVNRLAPARAFSTNFMVEGASSGATINVPFIGSASGIGVWTEGTTDFTTTQQDVSANSVQINLNTRRFANWTITSSLLADYPQISMRTFVIQKANALAKAVLEDIFTTIVASNFSDKVTVATASFDVSSIADIREKCSDKNWPDERFLFLSPSAYKEVLSDATVIAADSYGSDIAQATGNLERTLLGFKIIEANFIPANSENLYGFAINPTALGLASRVIRPVDGGNTVGFEVLGDAATGLALGYRQWIEPGKDKAWNVLDFSYGKKVINGDACIRIVSA